MLFIFIVVLQDEMTAELTLGEMKTAPGAMDRTKDSGLNRTDRGLHPPSQLNFVGADFLYRLRCDIPFASDREE